jgi:hypothetical protein
LTLVLSAAAALVPEQLEVPPMENVEEPLKQL